jgi:hypothetical protein
MEGGIQLAASGSREVVNRAEKMRFTKADSKTRNGGRRSVRRDGGGDAHSRISSAWDYDFVQRVSPTWENRHLAIDGCADQRLIKSAASLRQ